MFKQIKKLGISLSGGGSKAISFFGFIRALESEGIQVSMYNGHSAAGWLLCFMNSGMSDDEIIKSFSKLRLFRNFHSLNPIRNKGFIKLEKMLKYFKKVCDKKLEDLDIKTTITASDLTEPGDPKPYLFDKGPIWEAAVAASVVPPVMPLYKLNDRLLCDGGYLSLYNAPIFRKNNIDVVIGLFPAVLQSSKLPGLLHGVSLAQRTIIAKGSNYERKENPVDLEVSFEDVNFGMTDFRHAEKLFELGYLKGKEHAAEIKELVS